MGTFAPVAIIVVIIALRWQSHMEHARTAELLAQHRAAVMEIMEHMNVAFDRVVDINEARAHSLGQEVARLENE